MRMIIAGGGTGGHLFPGIAVAERLREVDGGAEILFVGTEKGLESRLVPEHGFDLAFVRFARLKNAGLLERLRTMADLPGIVTAAARIVRRFKPDVVLGVGGYASGPVVLSAALMGIPTAICEQNTVAGLTNRVLARVVREIYTGFPVRVPGFPAKKVHWTGNPVRASLADAIDREPGDRSPLTLFVLGGSQGAQYLNAELPRVIGAVRTRLGVESLQVLHQAGRGNAEKVRAAYGSESGVTADVVEFIDEMGVAYNRADLMICRAGALTVSETTLCGRPAVFVPFPFAADNHQETNAALMVSGGAALLVKQGERFHQEMTDAVSAVLADRDRLHEMARSARRLAKPDATAEILRRCQEMVQ